MELLVDGWSILTLFIVPILVFCLTVFGLGYLGVGYYFNTNDQPPIFRFLTIASAGSLLLTWASLILAGLGRVWLPLLTMGSKILPMVCSTYLLVIVFRGNTRSIGKSNIRVAMALGLLFLIYLVIRLAFLKDIVLPPYDDSPEHFMIVRDLLTPAAPAYSIFQVIRHAVENYYHIGFHAMTAWLTSASNANPLQVMSLLGQIFIWISSLSILYLTLVMTESVPAGIVAAIFAAVAWKMPAFAANWGKYPAITGLALLPAWLGLLSFSWREGKRRSISIAFCALIILGLSLIHTRLAICLVMIGAGYVLSSRVKFNKSLTALNTTMIFCAALVLYYLFIQPIRVFYSNHFRLGLLFIVLLLPIACIKYPRQMIWICSSMLGIWFASRAPVFLDLYGTNWLDAPFIETFLYIPFSLMAGLGYSGLLNTLENYSAVKKYALVIPLTVMFFGFTFGTTFYPDDCCNYVTRSDLKAMEWITDNTAVDSVVWVPGFKPRNYMIGTDAGVWVFALTGRNTNKLPFDFDWERVDSKEKICQFGHSEVNVFQSSMEFSFSRSSLVDVPWLETVFEDRGTRIYRIICAQRP